MLLIGKTPQDLKLELAQRFQKQRLLKNLSRGTLSQKSGVSEVTIKRFEKTGQINMDNFIALSFVLDKEKEIDNLFRFKLPENLEQLKNENRERGRK